MAELKCPMCGATFQTDAEMKAHSKEKHGM
jgi:uncharacterized C2H2 Zn-finger protein